MINMIDRDQRLAEVEAARHRSLLQKRFNLQWAWADSLATNVSQVYDQLTTAKENQIEQLKTESSVYFYTSSSLEHATTWEVTDVPKLLIC